MNGPEPEPDIKPAALLLAAFFYAKLKVRSWLRNIQQVSSQTFSGPDDLAHGLMALTIWEARRPRSCLRLQVGLSADSDSASDGSG